MTTTRRPLVAGNWKMNGLQASVETLQAIAAGYDEGLRAKVDLLVCPPATLLASFSAAVAGAGIPVGGQDCHPEASGAYTGDLSAEMLADAGARAVIVGHSERRTFHRETSEQVCLKAKAAQRAGLLPVICVGETREERDGGQALAVVGAQLDASVPETGGEIVIAYEPVWAIGTGLTPTAADVAEMHTFMRERLTSRFGEAASAMRLLYGGSVKPGNAKELLSVANVDGALVGGASLVAADFLAIASAYRE